MIITKDIEKAFDKVPLHDKNHEETNNKRIIPQPNDDYMQ
jgi:hypothetical protein